MASRLYNYVHVFLLAMFFSDVLHIRIHTCPTIKIIIIIIVTSYIAQIQCSVRSTRITPGHWTCSYMYHFNSLFSEHRALAAISALGTCRTHCHLCPTRYSFTPESNEACEGKVPRPKSQHRNNVPILRGEKHYISKKILQLAKLRALAIAPRPSLTRTGASRSLKNGVQLNRLGRLLGFERVYPPLCISKGKRCQLIILSASVSMHQSIILHL